MHIAVGSGNPVKREAVATAVEATVEAVAVASGVSEQPFGLAETIEGAETRAENALAATDAGLLVLLGGVERAPLRPAVDVVLVDDEAAVLTDGFVVAGGGDVSATLRAAGLGLLVGLGRFFLV